jgi:hypothetical protein
VSPSAGCQFGLNLIDAEANVPNQIGVIGVHYPFGQTRVILLRASGEHAAGPAATVNQQVTEYKKAISISV